MHLIFVISVILNEAKAGVEARNAEGRLLSVQKVLEGCLVAHKQHKQQILRLIKFRGYICQFRPAFPFVMHFHWLIVSNISQMKNFYRFSTLINMDSQS